MEIEYLNGQNSAEWDAFAEASSSAWFRHTTDWLKYSSCCRFDSNTRNLSFMVKQGGRIQAIVPLLAEYSYPDRDRECFAMYGDYTPNPAYADNGEVARTSVAEAISEQLQLIAEEKGVSYGKFMIDPLITYPYFNDFAPFNIPGLDNGAEVGFVTTNLVDLRLDLDSILRLMRKGHKAAIKQVMKEPGYRVDIFDKDNITPDVLYRFKEIHISDAGRQTRTDASWDCMLEWIVSGKACLTMLWMEDAASYQAGALIMHYKKAAYYASFATMDSWLLKGHAGHIIQWETIKYLKSKGIEFYETGANSYPKGDSADQAKLIDISRYKKGFRTIEVPKVSFSLSFEKK